MLLERFHSSSAGELIFVWISAFRFFFFFKFVFEVIIEIALSVRENDDIDICWEMNLSGLEYADDVVLLNEDPSALQDFPERLKDGVSTVSMRFAPSNAAARQEQAKPEPRLCH